MNGQDRAARQDGQAHIATLTATVDQLQAEVNGHEAIIALLVGCAIGTCILMVMLEVKFRRLARD